MGGMGGGGMGGGGMVAGSVIGGVGFGIAIVDPKKNFPRSREAVRRMRAEATARPFFESRSEKNLRKRRYKKVF